MDYKTDKPKCYLSWKCGDLMNYRFSIYRDFNWFQRKMLKMCFGFDYEKVEE